MQTIGGGIAEMMQYNPFRHHAGVNPLHVRCVEQHFMERMEECSTKTSASFRIDTSLLSYHCLLYRLVDSSNELAFLLLVLSVIAIRHASNIIMIRPRTVTKFNFDRVT